MFAYNKNLKIIVMSIFLAAYQYRTGSHFGSRGCLVGGCKQNSCQFDTVGITRWVDHVRVTTRWVDHVRVTGWVDLVVHSSWVLTVDQQ